jgi:hypothetical protein
LRLVLKPSSLFITLMTFGEAPDLTVLVDAFNISMVEK